MIIDPGVLGQFETKSGENAKSTYSLRTLVRASLAIKSAIGSTSSGEELGDALELSDATCITKVLLSGSSAAAANSESQARRSWATQRN